MLDKYTSASGGEAFAEGSTLSTGHNDSVIEVIFPPYFYVLVVKSGLNNTIAGYIFYKLFSASWANNRFGSSISFILFTTPCLLEEARHIQNIYSLQQSIRHIERCKSKHDNFF